MQRPQRHATGDADEQQHRSHGDLPHRPPRGCVQDRYQQRKILLSVSRVEDGNAAQQEQVGEKWQRERDATASSRGLVAPAVREHQVRGAPGQRPEGEELCEIKAQQRADATEEEGADESLEARRPRFAAAGDAVPP